MTQESQEDEEQGKHQDRSTAENKHPVRDSQDQAQCKPDDGYDQRINDDIRQLARRDGRQEIHSMTSGAIRCVNLALLDDFLNQVRSKPVSKVAVGVHGKDQQVRLLSRLD